MPASAKHETIDCISIPEIAAFTTVPQTVVRRLVTRGILVPDICFSAGRGVGFLFHRTRLSAIQSIINTPQPTK